MNIRLPLAIINHFFWQLFDSKMNNRELRLKRRSKWKFNDGGKMDWQEMIPVSKPWFPPPTLFTVEDGMSGMISRAEWQVEIPVSIIMAYPFIASITYPFYTFHKWHWIKTHWMGNLRMYSPALSSSVPSEPGISRFFQPLLLFSKIL